MNRSLRSNGHPKYCDCDGCKRRKEINRHMGEGQWSGEVGWAMYQAEEEAFQRGRVTFKERQDGE